MIIDESRLLNVKESTYYKDFNLQLFAEHLEKSQNEIKQLEFLPDLNELLIMIHKPKVSTFCGKKREHKEIEKEEIKKEEI